MRGYVMNVKLRPTHLYPIGQALLAAALFGASAPLSKLLLGEVRPIHWQRSCTWAAAAAYWCTESFGATAYRERGTKRA